MKCLAIGDDKCPGHCEERSDVAIYSELVPCVEMDRHACVREDLISGLKLVQSVNEQLYALLLVVVGLLVRVKLGAPVLFKQVRPYPLGHKGLAAIQFKMTDHCFFIANCYNLTNITATPIEEAQPWRFFIASKKVLDA